jgi:apolipoprotein N-acyltransferase
MKPELKSSTQQQDLPQKRNPGEGSRWLMGLAIALLCLGSPNRWWHWFPGALLGLALLFDLCEQRQGWARWRLAYGLWFWVCLYAFWVDPFSVKVLSAWEILGGVVVAPLIPLFFTTATLLSLELSRPLPAWARPLGLATVWTGLDGLLGLLWWPIPFHWGSLLFDWPLGIQVADVTGIWGVTFYAVFVNGVLWQMARQISSRWQAAGGSLRNVLGEMLRNRDFWGTLACGLGLTGLVLAYGSARLADFDALAVENRDPDFRVAAVQQVAWLEADRSWNYRLERYRELHQLSAQGVAAGAQLVIWPEGALRARLLNTGLEPYVIEPMQAILPPEGALITGATEPDPAQPICRSQSSDFLTRPYCLTPGATYWIGLASSGSFPISSRGATCLHPMAIGLWTEGSFSGLWGDDLLGERLACAQPNFNPSRRRVFDRDFG